LEVGTPSQSYGASLAIRTDWIWHYRTEPYWRHTCSRESWRLCI